MWSLQYFMTFLNVDVEVSDAEVLGSVRVYAVLPGKKHHLLVPYIDENGILQEPIFGISSFGGKAIRKRAAELYELVIKRNRLREKILEPIIIRKQS